MVDVTPICRAYTDSTPCFDAIVLTVLNPSAASDRPALRRRLLAERAALDAQSSAVAHAQLARQLLVVLAELQPQLLGLYVAIRAEFNARHGVVADSRLAATTLALPFCFRTPRRMEYRLWDCCREPAGTDECGIPTADGGAVAVPDVLVVPCVGYTAGGYRLGYGGGYFDRYLAAQPHITAVGVALSGARIDEADMAPQPHDRPLSLIVTERGVV